MRPQAVVVPGVNASNTDSYTQTSPLAPSISSQHTIPSLQLSALIFHFQNKDRETSPWTILHRLISHTPVQTQQSGGMKEEKRETGANPPLHLPHSSPLLQPRWCTTTITGNNDLPAHNLLFHYQAEDKKWGGTGNKKNVCEMARKEGKERRCVFPRVRANVRRRRKRRRYRRSCYCR